MKNALLLKLSKLQLFDKGFDVILRSNRGYVKVVAVVILCIEKNFNSGILKLFEGDFRQGIKPQIIYFSLTDVK